ncbi:hypothetical protein D8674_025983 [Pyrus ussuriensis x Pyrus communis]|uniref:Uncharacterized protein n=1 Tax=Pyrus ussuriensis x Pyrus communis TaxID=2448454 RepID=A0A5N5I6T5_9ROSA|nr:hypothetical protein D8674_025983 [Pyrus ussuriensis x Pyrus communis]
MTKKKDTRQSAYAYGDTIGYQEVMPLSKPRHNDSREVQSITLKNYKAEQLGCKQEAKFTSTKKYVDNMLGFNTEYQTESSLSKSNYNNKNCNSLWKLVRTFATEEFSKKIN